MSCTSLPKTLACPGNYLMKNSEVVHVILQIHNMDASPHSPSLLPSSCTMLQVRLEMSVIDNCKLKL